MQPLPAISSSRAHRHQRDQPSFPTRRSSDLRVDEVVARVEAVRVACLRQELPGPGGIVRVRSRPRDRKSTRLNSSHITTSYAVFCLKKKTKNNKTIGTEFRRASCNASSHRPV